MTCAEIREGLELYALGVAEADERHAIEEHLGTGCARCAAALREALATNAALLAQTELVDPPRGLKRRVLAGVGVHRAGWGWLGFLTAAAAMAVAVWIGNQERERTAELADARRTVQRAESDRTRLAAAIAMLNQPETRHVSFGTGVTEPPRGNVFIHSKMGVLLIASNLPKLAAGKAFEMWVIPKGGAPKPAGTFVDVGDGTAVHFLAGTIDTTTLAAVAVTVEPAAGTSAPTSTPIVVAAAAGL